MNTKTSLSALVAAVALIASGIAMAQANPPTSTPGAGCTATANAMKGGNLGGTASPNINCGPGTAPTAAAAPAPAPIAAQPAPAADTTASKTATTADSSAMGAAPAPVRKTRVARADRN